MMMAVVLSMVVAQALSLMGRMDLVGKCESQDLPAFKLEFGIAD